MSAVMLALPGTWRTIHAGPQQERDIDDAVAALDRTGGPPDSRTVAKHWMRSRLRAALGAADGADSDVVAVAYPEQPVGGVALPMTATILRLPIVTPTQDEAMRRLAPLATAQRGAEVFATPAGVVLRSWELRDTSSALASEAERAPLTAEERAEIVAPGVAAPMLRVRYVVPSGTGERWSAVVFSALVEGGESPLIDDYIALCDAVMQTLGWQET